jgi:AAA family ATP:ADP antiporter
MAAATFTYRAYVQSFRAGLKDRTVDAAVPINVSDVRTVELLVQSLGSTDARQVLHSLDILDANGRGKLVPPLLLYHDDPQVRLRTLRVLADVGRSDAAPLVERCLADADPDVRAEAIRTLTEFGSGTASDLMHVKLHESDPNVRAAAITCLLETGIGEQKKQAEAALRDMLSDAQPSHRAEAVKALGAVRSPQFEGALLGVLEDPDPRVVREAVYSVRRVLHREGFQPLYLPRLISLLQNRRVKLDAREVLVEFGRESVPILVHFLNDPGESIFVRRAIPKALARIGGDDAVRALVDSLLRSGDAFLRSQLVEALASSRTLLQVEELSRSVETAIQVEARGYLVRLADVLAVGGNRLRFEGPVVVWDRRDLDLLSQMLAERLEQHLRTLFGLLALLHPPHDVWAAYHGLLSGRATLRANALEYLDNTLSGPVRRNFFAVIHDMAPEEKVRSAGPLFGVAAITREESVRAILNAAEQRDDDAVALTVAALYTLYTESLTDLFPLVERVREADGDPLVQETAAWIADRVSDPPSPQEEPS